MALTNEEVRDLTGKVNGDKLDALFYLLLRDCLPAGKVEKIVMEVEDLKKIEFTNGFTANYAKLLADRMRY